MRSSRGFMVKQLAKMLVKIKRKIRCGIEAEEDDSSAFISQMNINKSDEIEYNIENIVNCNLRFHTHISD